MREFNEATDDTKLKHLSQEWSRSGWLVEQRRLLRGRYCERPRQYADSIVLIAERERSPGRPAADGLGSGEGIEGFACLGLKQIYLADASIRAGFVLDLQVRPGARFTSTGLALLHELERRAVGRGVALLYSNVDAARSKEGKHGIVRSPSPHLPRPLRRRFPLVR